MRTPATVIDLGARRRWIEELARDAELDAGWDRLTRLALDAWCWRDPASIAAIESCLADLKARVAADWA